MFITAAEAAFDWFTQIYTKAGYLSYFLGMIIITIVFDKIISPMMRGRGSDRADPRRSRKDSGSDYG